MLLFAHEFVLDGRMRQAGSIERTYGKAERYETVETNTRRQAMAKDLNKVMLTGYLGADPEMRYTAQGSAVTTFRVASSRRWKSADGADHDDTEWFRVVAT